MSLDSPNAAERARDDLGFVHRYRAAVPPGGGRTLLLLHGTGGDERGILPLGPLLDPDANVLSPQGAVLENGMRRFFRRFAEGVFDEPDLIARTHELAEFIARAAARYHFDPDRVVAAGFSNGANIAGAMLLLRPGVLNAALLFSPMVPLVPDPLPDLGGVPVFIGAGRLDTIAPPEGTEKLADLLRRGGADVTVHWEPVGHTLSNGGVMTAREWLAKLDT